MTRPRFVTFLGVTGLLVSAVPLFSALSWLRRLAGPIHTIEQATVVICFAILQLLIFAWCVATSIGLLRLRRWAVFSYAAACIMASVISLVTGIGLIGAVLWTAMVVVYFNHP